MMVERRQRPPGSAPGKCHRGIPGLYTLANAPDYSDEEWARYEEQRKQRKAKRDAEEGEECARYAEKQQRRIQDGAAILKVAPSQLKEPDIEALAWAVGYFQDNKDELTREGSKLYPIKQYRRYLAHAYEEHHRNPRPWSVFADPSFENASEVIEFCAFLIERGEPLPEALRSKVAEFLRKGGEKQIKERPGKRGPAAGDWKRRDEHIVTAVRYIVECWRLEETRSSRRDGKASAAAVVCKALKAANIRHMEEKSVNDICDANTVWLRYWPIMEGDSAFRNLASPKARRVFPPVNGPHAIKASRSVRKVNPKLEG